MLFLRQSTASQEAQLGPFIKASDLTELTALTIANTDIWIQKAGSTAEVNKNSGGGTHVRNGRYSVVFDATDTDTAGSGKISCHMATALPVLMYFTVLPQAVYDALFAGTGAGILANVVTMANDVVTAAVIATDAIGSAELAASAVTEIQTAVAAGAVASVTGAVGSVGAGGITSASFAAGAINAAAIATDAIGAAELATDAVTEIANAVAATMGAIPSAAVIADAVWDETFAAHQTAGSMGEAQGSGGGPSAAAIADAVWDETTSHLDVGSMGEMLNLINEALTSGIDLSAIADSVWNAAQSTHQAPGSMGAQQGLLLPAAIDAIWAKVLEHIVAQPGDTPTALRAMSWLYLVSATMRKQGPDEETIYDFDDVTPVATSTKGDTGGLAGTYTRGRWQ